MKSNEKTAETSQREKIIIEPGGHDLAKTLCVLISGKNEDSAKGNFHNAGS